MEQNSEGKRENWYSNYWLYLSRTYLVARGAVGNRTQRICKTGIGICVWWFATFDLGLFSLAQRYQSRWGREEGDPFFVAFFGISRTRDDGFRMIADFILTRHFDIWQGGFYRTVVGRWRRKTNSRLWIFLFYSLSTLVEASKSQTQAQFSNLRCQITGLLYIH